MAAAVTVLFVLVYFAVVLVLQIARVAVHLLLVQLEHFVLLSVAVVPQIMHGILPLLVAQDGIAVFPMRISVKHIGQKQGRGSFNSQQIQLLLVLLLHT